MTRLAHPENSPLRAQTIQGAMLIFAMICLPRPPNVAPVNPPTRLEKYQFYIDHRTCITSLTALNPGLMGGVILVIFLGEVKRNPQLQRIIIINPPDLTPNHQKPYNPY